MSASVNSGSRQKRPRAATRTSADATKLKKSKLSGAQTLHAEPVPSSASVLRATSQDSRAPSATPAPSTSKKTRGRGQTGWRGVSVIDLDNEDDGEDEVEDGDREDREDGADGEKTNATNKDSSAESAAESSEAERGMKLLMSIFLNIANFF